MSSSSPSSSEHVLFVKESLRTTENEINQRIRDEPSAARKDIVGRAYENHRKRVWSHFGFEYLNNAEIRDRGIIHFSCFDADGYILREGNLIALEEDKGHYADSCMHLRAFTEFAKTTNAYLNKNLPVPYMILHSFTRYKKHLEKLEELKDTWKPAIIQHVDKMIYTTLTSCDRLRRTDWIGSVHSTRTDSYTHFAEDALIEEDITFIKSLIPHQ